MEIPKAAARGCLRWVVTSRWTADASASGSTQCNPDGWRAAVIGNAFVAIAVHAFALMFASFSCSACGMNLRYAFSTIASDVPVCAPTVKGSTAYS